MSVSRLVARQDGAGTLHHRVQQVVSRATASSRSPFPINSRVSGPAAPLHCRSPRARCRRGGGSRPLRPHSGILGLDLCIGADFQPRRGCPAVAAVSTHRRRFPWLRSAQPSTHRSWARRVHQHQAYSPLPRSSAPRPSLTPFDDPPLASGRHAGSGRSLVVFASSTACFLPACSIQPDDARVN